MKKTIAFIFLCVFTLLAMSCSSSLSTSPTNANLPDVADEINTGRLNLGFYTVDLNPETLTGSITPNRELNAHMNAEEYLLGWPCGNCLRIKNLHFLPDNQIECDIEVTHPVSYPVFTVFDLRVIAIFPADEFFYGMGATTALLNSDGMTDLRKVKEILGDHMAVMGDVPAALLYAGTPDDIFTYVRELIRDVGPTGLILCPGCDAPINAKPENMEAMVAASREYGQVAGVRAP